MDTNEHECLRKTEKKTRDDADDTDVWDDEARKMNDEIVIRDIRLIRGLKLAQLSLLSVLPSQLYLLCRSSR